MKKHYILVVRLADLWLVGPFETDAAAADYGAVAERALWEQSPSWQNIMLADTYGLHVEAPKDLGDTAGAYDRACGRAAA